MVELLRSGDRARLGGRGVAALGAIAMLVALLVPASAIPVGERKSRLDTFSGSCEFDATVRFTPPLSPAERQTHAEALASGPCTGTWRSHKGTWHLDADEVLYKARSDGTQSCAAAEVPGEGLLKYRGRTLRFSFHEERLGASASIRLDGARGGRFSATASAEGDPAQAVQHCVTEGLGEAEATITGAAEPRISG